MDFKTYLITGGAGFIGANFVKYLNANRDVDKVRLIVLDALTYAGNLATIANDIDKKNVHFVHGDIANVELVKDVFDKYNPNYVINFAAESHVDRSITHARDFVMTNVVGTQTLLQQANESWQGDERKCNRFLQVSTDEVYGSLTKDFDEPVFVIETESGREIRTYGKTYFTEVLPLAARSPYSASKAAADMMALAYKDTFDLPVVITRCSNNYGPYQFPEKLIPLIINNLREGKELPIYGKGANVRDWLFVEDHVRAIYTVLHKGRTGEIYNVGGSNELDNLSLVRSIIDVYAEFTGTEPRHDLLRFVADRPGHDMRYAIDSTKLRKELGWYPQTTFEKGIRDTIKWYLDNTEWIDSVISGEYRNYYSQMYDNR